MKSYIGEILEVVTDDLDKKGIKYKLIDNNFSINGDTKLVTNVQVIDETVVLTTGDFIFDVRNKVNDKK